MHRLREPNLYSLLFNAQKTESYARQQLHMSRQAGTGATPTELYQNFLTEQRLKSQREQIQVRADHLHRIMVRREMRERQGIEFGGPMKKGSIHEARHKQAVNR